MREVGGSEDWILYVRAGGPLWCVGWVGVVDRNITQCRGEAACGREYGESKVYMLVWC